MSDYPHVDMAKAYVADVLEGRVRACLQIRQACDRFRKDLARENDNPEWPYFFDPAAGEKVCKFVSLLPHVKGRWAAKRELLTLSPWQAWIVVSVWGWMRKDTGKRRFRNAMVVVPRKSGKSALSAALGLFMLCADGEQGAEIYSGATSERQALEVFRPAQQMARATPALLSHFGVKVNAANINVISTGSRFEPIIGKPGDGASPSMGIVDEFHEHDTAHMRDTLLTGMAAREAPLLLKITTAGSNLAGPCFDDILSGRKVVAGTIVDEQQFFAEWTIDADTPWDSIEAMEMANPNLDVSVSRDFLLDRLAEAKRNPRDQGRFRTKHLNQWINARNAFFNMANWHRCRDESLRLEDFAGRPCVLSLDLASKQDIAAMNILFRNADGSYVTFGKYYLPEDVVNDAGKDHYRGWMLGGELIATPGNMISHERIAEDIFDLMERFEVSEVVFDPAQANWMLGKLSDRGVTVYTFTQWAKNYSEPMKELAGLIDAGKIRHPHSPNSPMSWMLANVVSKENSKEEVFPAKETANAKIDGGIALIMGLARLMLHPENTTSVYESRGILAF